MEQSGFVQYKHVTQKINTMKNILITLHILFIGFIQGQIAIGKTDLSSKSSILEFNDDKGGIILPYVTSETAVSTPSEGTFIFDSTDKKVKLYDGTTWIDLSINQGTVDTTSQNSLSENDGGVILGAAKSSAKGVLVLESSDKAMILPKVADPHLNVISPEPGTMVYDTTSKTISFYNGTQWSYWGEPL
ncbi:hypothetical protein UJ101_00938 [Flavobacteriaceae bacterium UJ101]|nr:hypothetical protein UJ101_00938 [Flavobacteriaceae bacterium UJ101]